MNSNINIKDVEERSNDNKSVHARCSLSTVRATSTPAYTMAGTVSDLASIYRAWLDCTSQGRWNDLPKYMHSTYTYNGQEFDPQTFVTLVQREANRFAGFTINVDAILIDDGAQCLSCRLYSKGRPTETIFGYEPPGQDVYFVEHHFAWFTAGKLSKTLFTLDFKSVSYQFRHPDAEYALDLLGQSPTLATKTLSRQSLEDAFGAYLGCVNDWKMKSDLARFCHSEMTHNGEKLTVD
ncbi:hypothetical protein OEA41_008223 [Lepraria neglecta]|uniref:SnoaL-like domain-containing protein n=1 Tax=Lepraria neglecta TaxID=209136 RepID=A0AAD9ZER1_9LECA|nr:hypothetical protein OEA41_008223 [Lepraria neglecta]